MERRRPLDEEAGRGAGESAPALRDAAAIGRNAEADEAAASAARERFRRAPMSPLEADELVSRQLRPNERVVAVHPNALLERRALDEETLLPAGGTLYLTSKRLLHVGALTTSVELEAIEETHLVGQRLAILLRGDEMLIFEVSGPRLLRVEIATAMAALREASADDARPLAQTLESAEAAP